jgi:hypothetical protein
MAPLQPLRIGIRLSTIEYTIYGGPPSLSGINTYLWTVFFKIDGETTSVAESLQLQGKATVLGTTGDHGDLGDSWREGNTAIPSQLGEYRTVLQPIPVPSISGMNVGGPSDASLSC